MAIIEHARTKPTEEAVPILHAVRATSWGAAANNLFVFLGATGNPPLVVGAALAAILWMDGAHEREFWQICAHLRKDNKELACEFTQ